MTVALLHAPATAGYAAVALLIGAESSGVPVPGETSLIAAAVLASQGHLSLPLVIAVAAVGAIVGDNVGYLIGRRGGRWLLTRRGRGKRRREQLLARGDAFFEHHGAKAVFFARWVPGLRMLAAWLAGTVRMPWPRFVLWNALGGISWATTIAIAAYLLGKAASAVLGAAGFAALALLLAAGLAVLLRRRLRQSPHARGATR